MYSERNTKTDASWWEPLILSLMAGLSTSLGAMWVFFIDLKAKNDENKTSPVLGHSHMAFALSLAGSVMVTVSFVSILPESFQDETRITSSNTSQEYHMLPFASSRFWQRCMSFALGCFLYFLLSKCAFPEPEEIIDFDEENTFQSTPEGKMDVTTSQVTGSQQDCLGLVDSKNEHFPNNLSHNQQAMRKQSAQLRGRGSSTPPHSYSILVIEKNHNLVRPSNSISSGNNHHNIRDKEDRRQWSSYVMCSRGGDLPTAAARRSWRVAMLLFVSLAVHNFPEGLAVAASTMHSQHLGITTAVAIAMHNIPEGLAIAVPCLNARPNSPCLAFWLATISGLAEPLGAIVALFILGKTSTTNESEQNVSLESPVLVHMANVLAFVAGIMTTVAFVELFPEARRHTQEGEWTPFIAGSVLGALVMIGTEWILGEGS